MIKYLLDTNICVEILRQNNAVRDKLFKVGTGQCAISEITVLELKMGEELARLKSQSKKYPRQNLNELLSALKVIPIWDALDYTAKEKVRLQVTGTPAHNNFDLLIGCTAVVNDMTMVTDNIKDFKNIMGIHLENWIKR